VKSSILYKSMDAGFFRTWVSQIRKGSLVLAILNDIRNRRMYGYEIERKFRKSHGILISEGTIYQILRRLRKHNLVKTTKTKSPDGPPRKYYELTKNGKETLAQMNAYWQALLKQTNSIEKG
jgi:PadR family transcriptional regulator PadR